MYLKYAMLVLFTEYSMDEFGMRYMQENGIPCRLRQDLINAIILKLRPKSCQFSKADIKKACSTFRKYCDNIKKYA